MVIRDILENFYDSSVDIFTSVDQSLNNLQVEQSDKVPCENNIIEIMARFFSPSFFTSFLSQIKYRYQRYYL